jgi:hypothetical protein
LVKLYNLFNIRLHFQKGAHTMDKKRWGIVLLAIGIILLVLSLMADVIGIGVGPGFGRNQILGSLAGIVAAGIGLFFVSRK